MAHLLLCCFPGACSRATMIALEEAGAAYDIRVVNLRNGGQKAADYVMLNPKGKVPTLIVRGTPLTENIAILNYLAETYPAAKLLPPHSDAFGRAQAVSAIAWLSSGVLPLYSRIMRPGSVCDVDGTAERIATIARDDIRVNLAIAEDHMRGRHGGLTIGRWPMPTSSTSAPRRLGSVSTPKPIPHLWPTARAWKTGRRPSVCWRRKIRR